MGIMGQSRRGFLFVILTMTQGLLFAGPKEIKAARQEAKKLVNRLEIEEMAASTPRRVSEVSLHTTAEGITLCRKNERGKIPLCRMNPTGRAIWDLCDGNHSAKDIGRWMVQRCRVSEERAKNDVLIFLTELKRIGAIRL